LRKINKIRHRIKCQNEYQNLQNAPTIIISAVVGYSKFRDKVAMENLVVTDEDEGLFFLVKI
jgi:hypothetical protein